VVELHAGELLREWARDNLVQYLPFLENEFFGNTVLQYSVALMIILGVLAVVKIVYFLIKKYGYRLTAHTETDLDDKLLDIFEEPFVLAVGVFGLRYALAFLTLPEGFADNLVQVLLVVTGAWFLVRLVDLLFEAVFMPLADKSKSKLDDQLMPILRKGLKAIVLIVTGIFVLSNFGYDITALLGGLGIAGLAIGMAAKDSLSNLLGSFSIFGDRPFEVGDYVSVAGSAGQVKEVGIRTTRIKTFDGTTLVIPNSDVANSTLENISKCHKRRILAEIGVEYSTSPEKLEKAKKILLSVPKIHEGIAPDSAEAYFTSFGDSALVIRFSYWVTQLSKRFEIMDAVNSYLQKEFAKNKIEFAYPSQTVYLKK
jgi:MscS family membrane protein